MQGWLLTATVYINDTYDAHPIQNNNNNIHAKVEGNYMLKSGTATMLKRSRSYSSPKTCFNYQNGRKVCFNIYLINMFQNWTWTGRVVALTSSSHFMAALRESIAWAVFGTSCAGVQILRDTFLPEHVTKVSSLLTNCPATNANR